MVKDKKNKKEEITFKPKEKIIKYFIETKGEPNVFTSVRTLSGAVLMDYKNTYNLVKELQPKILSEEKIGNTNLIKLNLSPNREIYSVEAKRTEEFLLKHSKLKLIKSYSEELNYPFLIVLIFGSLVKNTETNSSDIDICIISDSKEETKKLIERLNLLSLKLEIHEFTSKEFISMIEKKQNNLGREIVKNNIILYGIENYYNLISKWMKNE